jgi:hypothetical protein
MPAEYGSNGLGFQRCHNRFVMTRRPLMLLWRFTWEATYMRGTLTELSSGEVIRHIDVRKE